MNSMNGSGRLTGSAGPPAPVRRRRTRSEASTTTGSTSMTSTASTGSGREPRGDRRRDDPAGAGGGVWAVGTGTGPRATDDRRGVRPTDFFAGSAAEVRARFFPAARVAMRLFGPRTGVRSVKIQPTPVTGLPPTNRPSSNSHSYSPWNSWKESFEKTVAPTRSAISRRNLSPRPIVPAGGVINSFAVERLVVHASLGRIDAMFEGCVDDDGAARRAVARRGTPALPRRAAPSSACCVPRWRYWSRRRRRASRPCPHQSSTTARFRLACHLASVLVEQAGENPDFGNRSAGALG